MKILYGVQSDGMGHALRSRPVIEYLIQQGHTVKIITAWRALDFFKQYFSDVEEVEGFSFYYHHNRVSYIMTGLKSLLNSPTMIKKCILPIQKIIKTYRPDLIITDFEFFSAKAGLLAKIPVISIDNISMLFLAKLPYSLSTFNEYLIWRLTAKGFCQGAYHYFITSFFEAKLLSEKKYAAHVSFVPPILRKEILDIHPTIKNHIIVYQTTKTNRKLTPALHNCPNENFIYYGCDEDKQEKNIHYKKFSETQFIQDFASAKAVITNGGFTLIGEAVYLHKPIFCNPIHHHYEQYLNSDMVEKLGYGKYTKSITAEDIHGFIMNLSKYRKKLRKYQQEGNVALFTKLTDVIEEIGSKMKK